MTTMADGRAENTARFGQKIGILLFEAAPQKKRREPSLATKGPSQALDRCPTI